MNSKQRRSQRVFVHEVTLVCKNNERYFEFERRVEEAKGWLQWRTKRKQYTLGQRGYDQQVFKFRQPGLAAMFALKWV
jgi:hypothetical protein